LSPHLPSAARTRGAPVDNSGAALDDALDAEELGDAGEDLVISSAPADEFGEVLAILEDVMMDDDFNEKIDAFMRAHCDEFESMAAGEHQHAHYGRFGEYMALLETHIQAKMARALPGFDMAALCAFIKQQGSESFMTADFDALGAYGDFEAFREMMRAYKEEARLDFGPILTGSAARVWQEDDEEGTPMPELTLSISSPVKPTRADAQA
jgi:hypothetical protein